VDPAPLPPAAPVVTVLVNAPPGVTVKVRQFQLALPWTRAHRHRHRGGEP
jgi:hypothetical protein